MKLRVSGSAIALAALLISGPALAADLGSMKDTYEEPPPPVVNWTGFYISGGLGGSYMFTDLTGGVEASGGVMDEEAAQLAAVMAPRSTPQLVQLEMSALRTSLVLSALAFDSQMAPKWILGILGDYDFASSQDASVSGAGAINIGGWGGEAGVRVTNEMGDTWPIGARLGYLINQRTLVYALGGYSEAEFSLKGTLQGDSDLTGPFGPYSVSTDKEWRSGYFVGGGLETMLAENLSAKLEYRYAQYDGASFDVEDTFSVDGVEGVVAGGASMSDPDVHSIRAALSWRFGNWGR